MKQRTCQNSKANANFLKYIHSNHGITSTGNPKMRRICRKSQSDSFRSSQMLYSKQYQNGEMEFNGHRKNLILMHIRNCGTAQTKKPVAKVDFLRAQTLIMSPGSSSVAALAAEEVLRLLICSSTLSRGTETSSARHATNRVVARTGPAVMGSLGMYVKCIVKIQSFTFRPEESRRVKRPLLPHRVCCRAIEKVLCARCGEPHVYS